VLSRGDRAADAVGATQHSRWKNDVASLACAGQPRFLKVHRKFEA
jgi:hypothetical protein